MTVEKKVNEILNRLEKTKMERFPDLEAEKECRDHEERNEKKAQIQEMKRRGKETPERSFKSSTNLDGLRNTYKTFCPAVLFQPCKTQPQ